MRRIINVFCALIFVLLASCSKQKNTIITVKNVLDTDRFNEVVELSKEDLNLDKLDATVGIKDVTSGELLVSQLVDFDGDSFFDKILIQPLILAKSEKKYEVVKIDSNAQPKADELCYSRFVPERTDDYTWENDKVAFRVYGPVAQQLKESGAPGGTLSSGVDAWLKRVSYPVINKWYKETLIDKTGSYHKDTGEGLDNFHVGVSRGVGGIAVKNEEVFYYSKNYVKWRTITTGPLRTSFYLEYESWNAGKKSITESKIISLDLGNNLSKFQTKITGTTNIYAGLTLHDKDGEVEKGVSWVNYWQPIDDSEIGTAIVADKHTFVNSEKYDVEQMDLSNAYAELSVQNNRVVYYAGFAWKKSEQFPTKESWFEYLNSFADKINNPLEVVFE